jgi:shikimate dehydrogenase
MIKRAAVLGSPISHSLSPLIHNYAYSLLEYPAVYEAIEVKSGELSDFLARELASSEVLGFSLTMPLKEELAQLSTPALQVDARAKAINSANTIYKDGQSWKASSTDVDGFEFLLKDLSFSTVSILGAGGTARAAIASLSNRNVKIEIYRRSTSRDASLSAAAMSSQIEIYDWDKCARAWKSELVINTIPSDQVLTMIKEFSSPIILLDATYSPWPPGLTKQQLDAKGLLVSGLQLLAAQAVYQISLMTQIDFDKTWLYKELLLKIESAR